MNAQLQQHNFRQSKQAERIQTWFEPALFIYDQILSRKKENLRQRGYAENNAAVTKNEWRNAMATHYRLSSFQIQEIEQSLYRACKISYFGRDYMERKDEIQ